MDQVVETVPVVETVTPTGPTAPAAGNTVENLAGMDRDQAVAIANGLPSATDLDAVAAEQAIAAVAAVTGETTETAGTAEIGVLVTSAPSESDDPLDDENTFDVSRAEHNELLDAFLRLMKRIDLHNASAPHKI